VLRSFVPPFYRTSAAAAVSRSRRRSSAGQQFGKSSAVNSTVTPALHRVSADRWARVTTWGARLAWLAAAVIGGRAIGSATASRSDPVQIVATVGAWWGWAAGAIALAIPAVVTLTAVRVVVPGALAVTGACLAFGAESGDVLALGIPAAVAAVLTGAAETGSAYVQASAYGDERRMLLRPPLGYLAASVVSWAVWTAALLTAPLAWASRAWLVASLATIVAAVATRLFPRRWHQLSRRWLVTVPAGLVVHDPVVLGETLMLPRAHVRSVGLAELGTGAADLTGPTPGVAVEIRLTESTAAVLARRPGETQGRALRLDALLVSPSRPGAVLSEARYRGYSVAQIPPPRT
jgi:hypothetical protein